MKPVRQCKLCPWRVDADPNQIPDGYSEDLHRALRGTIAEPGALGFLKRAPGEALRIMACHHSPQGEEFPCAGWLHHQLGEGNNLALRLARRRGLIPDFEVDGPQHERFEDTLP